jgi:hypothetical protein
MIAIFKLISTAIESGKRIIKVNGFGRVDTRTASEAMPYGIDSNPIAAMEAVYSDTSNNGQRIVIGYINTQQLSEVGEMRLFATDANGAEKTRVWLHADGTIELGGAGDAGSNTNHAAQFEGLQTAFNKLRSDHNALVSAFNSHMHATAGTGSPSVPTPIPGSIPASPSAADITPAKLTNIKTE